MGWWPWSSEGPSSAKNNLDPSLQDFLNSQTHDTRPPPRASKSDPSKTASSSSTPSPAPLSTQSPESSPVPPQSQFQDGRYAHLWKTYQPYAVLESAGKTDQDKLKDVVDMYQERQSDLVEVAKENCSPEWIKQWECYRNPSWSQLAWACQKEQKEFNRCMKIQRKFLTALGYLTMDDRPQELSDRIQLHADKLYRQMREQEEATKKAKEAGLPEPQFPPVMAKENLAKLDIAGPNAESAGKQNSMLNDDVWAFIKPAVRAEYEKKFAKLPKEEQELERRAVEGELRVKNSMTKQLEAAFVEERINRMQRREKGQATVGDKIKDWWGWG